MSISSDAVQSNARNSEVVTICGNDFLIPKLNAREQFHLSSKVSVLVFGNPIEALSKLSEKDLDILFDACLKKVKCKDKNMDIWTPILADDGTEMFDWLDCKMCYELIGAVVNKNLGNFFNAQNGDGHPKNGKVKKVSNP